MPAHQTAPRAHLGTPPRRRHPIPPWPHQLLQASRRRHLPDPDGLPAADPAQGAARWDAPPYGAILAWSPDTVTLTLTYAGTSCRQHTLSRPACRPDRLVAAIACWLR